MPDAPALIYVALEAWFSSARLPRFLRGAGFKVVALCTSASPLVRAHGIDVLTVIDPKRVAGALDTAIAAHAPTWIVPADEQAVAALHRLARGDADASSALVAVLRRSLGVPAAFGHAVSKREINRTAARLGIRVPRQAVAETAAAARAFALDVGYPIVLKKEQTFGGKGVMHCRDDGALLTGWYRLQARHRAARVMARLGGGVAQAIRPLRRALSARRGAPLIAQSFITGQLAFHTLVADRGRVLGGISAVAEAVHPPPFGASTVVRVVEHPAMAQAAVALAQALGLSGFGAIDFILDPAGGAPYLLELNARVAPMCHLGQRLGVDLCAALFAAATGAPVPAQSPAVETTIALFPRELERDPASPWLATAYHDVPRDDPDLLAAREANLMPPVRAFLARTATRP
ncbi:MAG: hypothetical protein HY060_15440 [Proteobacteria bacterium]|nr:hypothetical protein [Pseudomonadota bacterium]